MSNRDSMSKPLRGTINAVAGGTCTTYIVSMHQPDVSYITKIVTSQMPRLDQAAGTHSLSVCNVTRTHIYGIIIFNLYKIQRREIASKITSYFTAQFEILVLIINKKVNFM